MDHRSRAVVASVIALCVSSCLVAAGCSAGEEDPGADGGRRDGAVEADGHDAVLEIAPGTVALQVRRAEERSSVADTDAGPTKMFVWVELAVANGLESSIAVAPPLFRLQTDQGLELLASALSAAVQGACPSDAFLGAGQRLSCTVVFQVERSIVPTSLLYVGVADGPAEGVPRQTRAEAPIDGFARCDRCHDACTDLARAPAHCGACDVSVPGGGSCVDGVPGCPEGKSACAGQCVDLQGSRQHCGQCFRSTGEASCVAGVPSCPGGETFVDGSCVDLSSHDDHCGAPHNACVYPKDCVGGRCLDYVSDSQQVSCDTLCAQQGAKCVAAGDNPWFEYRCTSDTYLALANAPCGQVPYSSAKDPSTGKSCAFDSVSCYCE